MPTKKAIEIKINEIIKQIPFFTGMLAITAILTWFDMGFVVVAFLWAEAFVLLVNFVLRGCAQLLQKKVKVKKLVVQICTAGFALIEGLVFFGVSVYNIQDHLFFHPVKGIESQTFLQNRPGYQEVTINSASGKTYHGVMYQTTDQKAPLVIYFGGNGECSYQRMQALEMSSRWDAFAGYHMLYMDYEGYGLNDGNPYYLNMYEEALTVYDYAMTLPNVDTDNIVSMGYSLGTGVAVYLAANRNVDGLILCAPYENGYDTYNKLIPIFYGPLKLLVKQKLPSSEYAKKVTCPTLVVASHADEMVPFSSSKRLLELFSGEVDFVELETKGHNEIFQGVGVYEAIQSFLVRVGSESLD